MSTLVGGWTNRWISFSELLDWTNALRQTATDITLHAKDMKSASQRVKRLMVAGMTDTAKEWKGREIEAFKAVMSYTFGSAWTSSDSGISKIWVMVCEREEDRIVTVETRLAPRWRNSQPFCLRLLNSSQIVFKLFSSSTKLVVSREWYTIIIEL